MFYDLVYIQKNTYYILYSHDAYNIPTRMYMFLKNIHASVKDSNQI